MRLTIGLASVSTCTMIIQLLSGCGTSEGGSVGMTVIAWDPASTCADHAPACEQLAEHVRQDAAVFIVTDLLGSVDPDGNRETDGGLRRRGSAVTVSSRPARKRPATASVRPSIEYSSSPVKPEALRRSRRA